MSTATALPPGPKTPKALNAPLFLFARRSFFARLQRRYGDAFTVPLPVIGNAVVLCHPDLIKTMFTADPTVLHGGKNPLGEVLGPGSLFSMDEERHLNERRMLLPPFHGERMRSYDALIEEEAQRALRTLPYDNEVATLPVFNKITLRVILRAVFGAEGAELAELEHHLPAWTALGQRLATMAFLRRDLGPRSPGGRFRAHRAEYDRIIDRLIDKHLADPDLDERIDILALMLRSLRDAGEEINRTDVADELLTLLAAGHETTASSLAWAVERLSRHPDILRRLEAEAETEDTTLRTATILELQRHRTIIAGTGRRATQPFQLGEWLVPTGTVLISGAATVHADERFHVNAGQFDPDRFVGVKPGTYTWTPFGGGMRRCLGAAFAQLEMDVVLRTLLRQYELVPTTAPAERESFRGIAYAPAKGGVARFRRRATPLGAGVEATVAADRCPVAH